MPGKAVVKRNVKSGRKATLTCSAAGDPNVTVSWAKLDTPLSQLVKVDVRISTVSSPDYRNVSSQLMIPSVQCRHVGSYVCTAVNGNGLRQRKRFNLKLDRHSRRSLKCTSKKYIIRFPLPVYGTG